MDTLPLYQPHATMREMLRKIMACPGMYLSKPSIIRLRSFLDGLSVGLFAHPLRAFENPLAGFDDWEGLKLEGSRSGARDWCTIILGHSENDEQAFHKFCDLFLEFNEDYRGFSDWYWLWSRLHLGFSPGSQFDILMERYAEPHRAYHNRAHVLQCLSAANKLGGLNDERSAVHRALFIKASRGDDDDEEADRIMADGNLADVSADYRDSIMQLSKLPEPELKLQLENQDAIEMALWFHDAIYDTRAKDNEEKSAALADRVLAGHGATEEFRGKVRHLIMLTMHDAVPQPGDESIMVGADLAILGAPEAEFWKYEEAIRKEYAWVPELAYGAARGMILRSILDRPAIFTHPHFTAKYEGRARENLKASLERLSRPV